MSLEDQAIAGENTDAAQQSLKALFGDDIDPNVVMKLLKGLSPDKINNTLMPVKNGNAQIFPQSYRTFQKLTNGQLNKFKSYWESMTEPSRAAILAQARIDQGGEKSGSRQEYTTKNDLARLMHLRTFPDVCMTWQQALGGSVERSVLDMQHSHESAARDHAVNPFNILADVYNCRLDDSAENANNFQPENLAIKYVDGNAVTPYEARENGKISKEVATALYDIDPNQRERPNRNGDWIKKHYSELKTKVTQVWHNFSRSGQQAGDCESKEGIDDWVQNFCSGQQVLQYAILVWDKSVISSLGKKLPSGTGMDSGILDAEGNEIQESSTKTPKTPSVQSVKRAERRQAQKRKLAETDSPIPVGDESPDNFMKESMEAMLEQGKAEFQRSERLESLKFLAQFGRTEEVKMQAMDEIMKLAGFP